MNSLHRPDEVPQFVWDGLTEAGQFYLSRALFLKKRMASMAEELEQLNDAAEFELGVRKGRARLVETKEEA